MLNNLKPMVLKVTKTNRLLDQSRRPSTNTVASTLVLTPVSQSASMQGIEKPVSSSRDFNTTSSSAEPLSSRRVLSKTFIACSIRGGGGGCYQDRSLWATSNGYNFHSSVIFCVVVVGQSCQDQAKNNSISLLC